MSKLKRKEKIKYKLRQLTFRDDDVEDTAKIRFQLDNYQITTILNYSER